MIDINKKYTMRDGREVRIYATDGGGDFPVHGAIKSKDGSWHVCYWTKEGTYLTRSDHEKDLIEVRPRHKRTVWLNAYEREVLGCYEHKSEADNYAGKDRLACIKVDLDFTEGDGL